MTKVSSEHEPDYYLQRGQFIPKDKQALKKAGILIYPPLVKTHKDLIEDFKKEGLKFVIAKDLEVELITRTKEKPSHANELAFNPGQLFISESGNLPLADQDAVARSFVRELKEKLGLTYVDGGISRITDYEIVILQHLRTRGEHLLKAGTYPYPSARTRTRIYPELSGPANYVPYIGPFSKEGLRIDILGRDEGDPEIGAWVLLYPSKPKDT